MSADRRREAGPRILYSAGGKSKPPEVLLTAVNELQRGLSAMLGRELICEPDPRLLRPELRIAFSESDHAAAPLNDETGGDSFSIVSGAEAVSIRSGSARGLIHGSADFLERLGARFAPGSTPEYPRVEASRVRAIAPYAYTPSFNRRAFVSDIMTWNYNFADRLELHLRHDREFIPWMTRRGASAFSFIRHAHDTRLRIDEAAPIFRAYGTSMEYGGHVLQLLLPRELFEKSPSMFPADDDGTRQLRGNLCVSSAAALRIVREAALRYVTDYPENQLLHIWGADVRGGAWCQCGSCRDLAPQLQYMKVVNAIADALTTLDTPPLAAYLAYHDTIDPVRGLKPLANVWVEWAPRERCYSHPIDHPGCETNLRYFNSLKRYMEIFEGRCHVFEYYADAILFGGLGFATPEIVARDLRSYHALGIRSVSCLTFGAYSVLSYPVNLETFLRCANFVDFQPNKAVDDAARGRHFENHAEMSAAYRIIADASKLVLDYADVMSPRMFGEKAHRKQADLTEAVRLLRKAIDVSQSISRPADTPIARAERKLWRYSEQVLDALSIYLAAGSRPPEERISAGEAALKRISDAAEHIRSIDSEIKGTWGEYDLEWMREMWLDGLRRALDRRSSVI